MRWFENALKTRQEPHLESPAAKQPELGTSEPCYSKTRVIPFLAASLSRNRLLCGEDNYVAEQFKILRTLIFNSTRPKSWNTLQISGFDVGDGKSLVAANLAISIARDSRQTTLLVDLNFRNPTIHKLFGLGETPGLVSYFTEGVAIEELLVSPGIAKLTILTAGGRLPRAPELIGSPRMEALVGELKERYQDRYIIFDTPPMHGFPDALVFSQYVDAVLLVARAGFTSRASVKSTMDLVPREKVLGMIFNNVGKDDLAEEYGTT